MSRVGRRAASGALGCPMVLRVLRSFPVSLLVGHAGGHTYIKVTHTPTVSWRRRSTSTLSSRSPCRRLATYIRPLELFLSECYCLELNTSILLCENRLQSSSAIVDLPLGSGCQILSSVSSSSSSCRKLDASIPLSTV